MQNGGEFFKSEDKLADLREEHAAYARALAGCGVAVEMIEAPRALPQSIFVNDMALTFKHTAILLRPVLPIHPSVTAILSATLAARFARVINLPSRGFVSGRDIVVTEKAFFIGLSTHTDLQGATDLVRLLARLGHSGLIVPPLRGISHLRKECCVLAPGTLFMTRAMAEAKALPGMDALIVPEGEEATADAVRINDWVLLPAGFPKSTALLAAHGFSPRPVKLDAVMRVGGGLSCMSLRWHDPLL